MDELSMRDKMRIIQELVPGKQITLAHIIANPDPVLYRKLGLDPKGDYGRSAAALWEKLLNETFNKDKMVK